MADQGYIKMHARIFCLTAIAVFATGCTRQPVEPVAPVSRIAFDDLAEGFSADYAALELPAFDISFVTNLKALGGAEALEEQREMFKSYRNTLAGLNIAELDVCRMIDFSIMKNESDFGARRAELGLKFLELSVSLDEVTHLAGMPMGEEWYDFLLDKWNSADLDPDEIYSFGEEQLRRAVARYDTLQNQMRFKGDDNGLMEHLSSSGYVGGGEETIALFMEKQTRVWSNLHRLFPDDYDVTPAKITRSDNGDSAAVPGFYNPDEETFYYNAPSDRYEARQTDWLFLHEGTPGHHFQMKAEKIGTRCADSVLPEIFFPAYVEGWAAYAETLGEDLGLYETPEARLAAVEWDMVRSVRVVLDVALNAYGWSDEKALAYWRDNVRGQEDIAMRQIARMKRWPAQVVTYKYGANVFETVKAAHMTGKNPVAAAKSFHDAAIAYGSMPLSTFEDLFAVLVQYPPEGEATPVE